MEAPSVMLIEIAAGALAKLPDLLRKEQLAELATFGDPRAQSIGASGISTDFQKGYELGLQTERAAVATWPALIIKGVDPTQIP